MTTSQRIILALVVLSCCTGFDQFTKDIARQRLAASPPISLLNDTIRIQYSENPGATLGAGSNLPEGLRFALFVVLSGLITIATLILALKTRDLRPVQIIALLLVASGGLGNLLDRLFNDGAAIDFLNLGVGSIRTGIFNIADVFIVGGAAMFILFSLRDRAKATAT